MLIARYQLCILPQCVIYTHNEISCISNTVALEQWQLCHSNFKKSYCCAYSFVHVGILTIYSSAAGGREMPFIMARIGKVVKQKEGIQLSMTIKRQYSKFFFSVLPYFSQIFLSLPPSLTHSHSLCVYKLEIKLLHLEIVSAAMTSAE